MGSRACGEMYQDRRLSLRRVLSSRCRDTHRDGARYQLTPPPRVCCTARRISTCSSAAYLTDPSRANSKAEGPNVPGSLGDIGLMVGSGGWTLESPRWNYQTGHRAGPVPLVDDALYQPAVVGHTSLVRLDDGWIGVGQCTNVPRKQSHLMEPRLSDLSSWGMSSPQVPFESDRQDHARNVSLPLKGTSMNQLLEDLAITRPEGARRPRSGEQL